MTNKKSVSKKTFPEREDIPMMVVGALADAFAKSPTSILRWIDSQDDRLTSDRAKAVYNRLGFVWNSEWVLEGNNKSVA